VVLSIIVVIMCHNEGIGLDDWPRAWQWRDLCNVIDGGLVVLCCFGFWFWMKFCVWKPLGLVCDPSCLCIPFPFVANATFIHVYDINVEVI
jgi:hypothetical protein